MLRLFRKKQRQGALEVGIPGSLTGAFDLQGETLAGHVERLPGFSAAGTKVQAKRGAKVIAEAEPADIRGENSMPFRMPIESRFTLAELAKEEVVITVCNNSGDTGVLVLNGNTRLALIKEYLGAPVEPLIEVDFGKAGNATERLGPGWSGAEDDFRWTLDDDSYVQLSPGLIEGICRLRFQYAAFINNFVARQEMEVFINDYSIGSCSEESFGPHYQDLRINADALPKATPTTLRFHHPFASRPSDHSASNDRRRLAYRFYRMSLVREPS